MPITPIYFFYALLLMMAINSKAQDSSSVHEDLPCVFVPYSHGLILNLSFNKDNEVPFCYKKENSFYFSSSLYLYPDSSFVYSYFSPGRFELSTGNYQRWGNLFRLDWDSLKTLEKANDPDFYKEYFKWMAPSPFAIRAVYYTLSDNHLSPYQPKNNEKGIRLLCSSAELYTSGKEIPDFHSIRYNEDGKKLIVFYGDKKELKFSIDSIWGFITHLNGQTKVFRKTKKNFNWYGFPGIQVAQIDQLIFYYIGETRVYSYFSKDLNSEIYSLEINEIKKQFSGMPLFVKSVSKGISLTKPIHSLDEYYNSYKVLELYRNALSGKENEGRRNKYAIPAHK